MANRRVLIGCLLLATTAIGVGVTAYRVGVADVQLGSKQDVARTDLFQSTIPTQRDGRAFRVPVPTTRTENEVQARLTSKANYLHAALGSGTPQTVCTPGVQAELETLLKDSEGYGNLWTWAFERLLACRQALSEGDAIGALFENALRTYGKNPRVLELLAEHNLQTGNPREAVSPAVAALQIRDSYEGWATLASARLALADEATMNRDRAEATLLYREAFDAASRAAAMAGVAMHPFQLLKMAQATQGQGRETEALNLAAEAEQAMRAANSNSQARLSSDFFMQLGAIYYRAGQRDIGVAYMDQAISMATSDQVERLSEWKRRVIAQAS